MMFRKKWLCVVLSAISLGLIINFAVHCGEERAALTAKEPRAPTVYFLNMDRSVDRRNTITDQAEALDMSVVRIEAIDSADPSDMELVRAPASAALGRSEPELCCLASHLRMMWRALQSTGDEYVVLTEDDVDLSLFAERAGDLPEVIRQLPPDWEVLQLWTGNNDFYVQNEHRKATAALPWPGPRNFGMVAYAVHRRALATLGGMIEDGRAVNVPLRHDAAYVSDDFVYKSFNSFSTTTPFFRIWANDSTIHPDHVSWHNDIKAEQRVWWQKREKIRQAEAASGGGAPWDGALVLNLDRQPERMRRTQAACSRAGIVDLVRVPGVDGSSLSAEEVERVLSHDAVVPTGSLPKGWVGNYLGIRALLSKGTSQYDTFLMMEDDIFFAKDFMAKSKQAVRMCAGFDMIYFGLSMYCTAELRSNGSGELVGTIDPIHKVYKLKSVKGLTFLGGNFGVLLRKHMGLRWLEGSLPIRAASDVRFLRILKDEDSIFYVDPPLINYRWSESDIALSSVMEDSANPELLSSPEHYDL